MTSKYLAALAMLAALALGLAACGGARATATTGGAAGSADPSPPSPPDAAPAAAGWWCAGDIACERAKPDCDAESAALASDPCAPQASAWCFEERGPGGATIESCAGDAATCAETAQTAGDKAAGPCAETR